MLNIFRIGWIDNALLALVLLRGLRCKLVSKFVMFYVYVTACLAATLLLSVVPYSGPEYARCYWIVNFATLFLRCAILWGMFDRTWVSLVALRWAGKFGQCLLGIMIAAATTIFVLLELRNPLNNIAFRHLETDCRAAQAIIFIAIVWVICHYDVPIGRNFKAICLGYGVYILASLVSLSVLSYGATRLSAILVDLQAVSFDAATAVWLIGLWNADTAAAMPAKQERIREQRSMRSDIELGTYKPKLGFKTKLA